jgi:hypothetical protein
MACQGRSCQYLVYILFNFPQEGPSRLAAARLFRAPLRSNELATADRRRACPKEISVRYIAELNRDYLRAALTTDQLSKLPERPELEE